MAPHFLLCACFGVCVFKESKAPNSGIAITLGDGGCTAQNNRHTKQHIIFRSFLQRTTIFSVPIELNYILSGSRSCLDAFEQLGAFTDDVLDMVTAG